ncbi:alpha/beta hydrolase [Amycolatopsis rhabdoformis]|uniref:Alpha/beta hydrolase n=1 Tax=Amycolatopsis rhabdoformis TaxID=1448059 RepID=A0ABZ1ICT5_9PSEU|nr:alpha/beta hydrolase [Amycolatopsis rhabdoformis]WSE32062.1 alpha/beta hydrolase [Amycolatopsis rhabdoformis]
MKHTDAHHPGQSDPAPARLTRRSFAGLAALGATGLALASPGSASAAAAPAPRRSVVLVHGAYADGSCWADVIGRLQAAGVEVASVQNPLTSLADDVAATRRELDLQPGRTVLVGHSYGGSVISEAGVHPAVDSLVYLSARAPLAGEDYPALTAKFPTAPASSGLVFRNGFGQLTENAFMNDFANGVPTAKAKVLYAAQGRVAQDLFSTKTTAAAWESKPSSYVITTADRTTAPELQRFVAARMKARTTVIASGHLSFLTHPDTVTRVILDAVHRP